MNNSLLLLAIIVLVPIVVAVLFRINAAILFMSLCVGEVLVQFVANDATSFASAVSPRGNTSENTVRLILLLVPPILTAIFMFHSVRGGVRASLNIIPAVTVGLLLALLIEPLLSPGVVGNLQQSGIWRQFSQAQTLVVITGAFLSLLFLWMQRPGLGHADRSHHSKHR